MRLYFVSSTFRDMGSERDMILHRVLPEFRAQSRTHGEEADIIDLRVGIDTFALEEGDAIRKVLAVCTESIGKCKPLMIIFIGDRYGYIPKADCVTKEFVAKFNVLSEKNVEIEALTEKSVTALEIEYGLFQGRASKCIICIRTLNGEFSNKAREKFFETDKKAAEKIICLKNLLRCNYSDRIIEYTADWNGKTLENFRTNDGKELSKALLERMVKDCEEDWREFEKLSWQTQEQIAAWRFAEGRAQNFIGRSKRLNELEKTFEESRIVFLNGEKGSGKTSILSKIAIDFKKHGRNVCCIFSGSSTYSSNAQNVLRQMIFFVEEILECEHFSVDNQENQYMLYKMHFEKLCQLVKINEPIYFVIDSVDQLETDNHRKFLDFLTLIGNIHYLVSGAEFDFSFAKRILGVVQEETLDLLADVEVEKVLRGILQKNGKELFEKTALAVQNKSSKNSPLYLALIAQILGMLSTIEFEALKKPKDIIETTVKFVENIPEGASAAAVHILKVAAQRLCEKPADALEVVKWLAISPHGLRFSDLQKILKDFRALDYALLQKFLYNFFLERQDGLIDFSHSLIRDGILNSLDKNIVAQVEKNIADYVKNLPENDSLRCLEGAFYSQKFGDYEFFAQLLGEAFRKKNPQLLYGIEQTFRFDGGKMCIDLLQNHMNQLDKETIGGCYAFFFTIFRYMLCSSGEEYEIGKKIYSALPSPSRDEHLNLLKQIIESNNISLSQYSFENEAEFRFWATFYKMVHELNLATQEFYSGELARVNSRCKKITHWGEKNIRFRKILGFCRLIACAYSWLVETNWAYSNHQELSEAASNFIVWAKFAASLSKEAADKMQLATAYAKAAGFKFVMLKPPPFEKILDYHKRAREIYLNLLEENSSFEVLKNMPINSVMIASSNLKLGRTEEAKFFLRESERYTKMLLTLYPSSLETLMVSGGAFHNICVLEILLGDYEASDAHALESINLCREIQILNPTADFSTKALFNVLESIVKNYREKGENVRADRYENLASELRQNENASGS